MSSSPDPEPVTVTNPHHRRTLLQLFQHPTSRSIEWHAVFSLLEAVGSVEVRHGGEYAVHVGAETAFLGRPKGKDMDVEQVLVVRRLLSGAGYGSVVDALRAGGDEV
jgi:hypothetical protein